MAASEAGLAIYPPISAANGGPPFHPRFVHVLTPFVERLATDEEKSPTLQSSDCALASSRRRYGDGAKRGVISLDLLNKSPAELQRRFRKEFPDIARRAGERTAKGKRLFANRCRQA